MEISLADIFRIQPDLQSFCQEVLRLEGHFVLGREEMELLGQAYFEKYPEKYVQRNMNEVRLGYQLTRFCFLEKALENLPAEVKSFFRKAFDNPAAISTEIENFLKSGDRALLFSSFVKLKTSLEELKATVDELPKGMIKERFLGGLTTLFNVSYLLEMFLSKLNPECLQD